LRLPNLELPAWTGTAEDILLYNAHGKSGKNSVPEHLSYAACGPPPAPWHWFLTELDSQLDEEVNLHCIGGFAFTVQYGLVRPTYDIDFLPVAPRDFSSRLLSLAGPNSRLYKKHGVYLQLVNLGVVYLPHGYLDRPVETFPFTYTRLHLSTLEPYDLALSKLQRDFPQDREDVKQLALRVPLNSETLRRRYQDEVRPNIANVDREDLTINSWVEMIDGVQGKR